MGVTKQGVGTFVKYISLLLGTFAALFPIIVVFLASLKTSPEFAGSGALAVPENWLNFTNYSRVFIEGKMLRGFMNTAIMLAFSVVGAILFGTMIAYVLSRFRFAGSKVIMALFLIATLIPGVTTQVATFKIINSLGLFNTMAAPIVLYVGTDIIAIYVFLQFLNRISMSLDESAMLDGASYFTIYSKIIMPLMKPAIATIIIIKGVSIYNDFYIPFLYMPKADLLVISTTLFKFIGPYGSQWEVICAGIIITILPSLIIFLTLQKYIYNGYAQGAEK